MKKGIALASALLVLVTAAPAMSKIFTVPVWFHVNAPTDTFGDFYSTGYGFSSSLEFTLLPIVSVHGGLGWTRFSGEGALEDIDVWEYGLGARAHLGLFYGGLEVDHFSEIDEWGWVPEVGVRFTMLDAGLRYKMSGDANWWGIRAGIRF